MIQHHPDDGLLLAQAAGRLSSGHALLVASHLDHCEHCRDRLVVLESLGGAMLEALPPAVLASQSLVQAMAAIDAEPDMPEASVVQRPAPPLVRPTLPEGMAWPRALAHCSATPWRWLAPGMRWSRVSVPYDAAAKVFLLRIGAGKELAFHTHSQSELTQVLHGAFHDGRSLFGPGDFDETDGDIHHQPKVLENGECICLASVEGRVMFKGAIARLMGSLIGM
ncbi:ChrR family anti-sigma-E factor [Variovorax sp. J22P168]|uniref:ChrR family anti-sigma-E factor n=1 Tax=Variovorax jilinensis TaxID=3053513 RepID=UPI0025774386|nr:ChrR family anti-sigma-E factor [Variovorax sp. J22P168]MDM0011287.1 ChrR family anti-sigma-E factor [Variovorax sp. J22P168]